MNDGSAVNARGHCVLVNLKENKSTMSPELYQWEFNGPFLRDFAGNEPVGKRDAGALELVE